MNAWFTELKINAKTYYIINKFKFNKKNKPPRPASESRNHTKRLNEKIMPGGRK